MTELVNCRAWGHRCNFFELLLKNPVANILPKTQDVWARRRPGMQGHIMAIHLLVKEHRKSGCARL